MKKLLTLFLTSLMVLTSTGTVFADEPEDPNIKPTELSYEVTEGYEWSVPTKLEFTAENFADVVATDGSGNASKIAISKCTLTADKTLLIEVDAEQVFEIAESNGHTLDYSIKANNVSVGAGDVVLSLDSGEDCEGVDSEIKGTLTKDVNEIAGDYSGTLTFLAEIVRGGKAIKVVADGTTATNVRFTAMPTNKQNALKADLKLAGTSSLSDAELAAALVIDIDADTAGDVKMDISKLANEGDKVLVYHKSSTNGWELLGEVEVGADGTVTCSFTDYSPILVSKKEGSSQEQETLAPGLYADGVMYKALTLDDCGTNASKVKALITQANTKAILPEGVTSVTNSAFNGCSNLESIIIPNSVTNIGGAFYNCKSLKSVIFKDNSQLYTTGYGTFEECSNLESITLPNSITEIYEAAFSGCSSLTSITIPNSVTSIADNAFYGCSSLASITIPNSVTSIGSFAFNGCSSLESVIFEDNSQLANIGERTFQKCSGLSSITIPNSVTSIADNAFNGIPHVYYNGSATIGSPWGAGAIN